MVALLWALSGVCIASPIVASIAHAGPTGVVLAPHRAVYDMVLNPSNRAGGNDVGKGRMVYEFTGSACKGYNISMRWVTERGGSKGNTIEDLRYVSWEAGDGQSFTFSSIRYVDQRLVEEMESSANKGADGQDGVIKLSQPKTDEAPLPSGTSFPAEQLRMVLADAMAGRSVRTDKVYDVSDDGKEIYDTFTLITPLSDTMRKEGVAKVPELAPLDAWSANISYFSGKDRDAGERVPVYEQNFSLFANGVSTHMRLGTPSVIIDATLHKMELLPTPEC